MVYYNMYHFLLNFLCVKLWCYNVFVGHDNQQNLNTQKFYYHEN